MEIRVISWGLAGGSESPSAKKAYARRSRHMDEKSIYMTGKVAKQAQKVDPLITFTEEDSSRLQHLHDDALVITVMITGYITWRVLTNNGTSVNILYLSAFQQMKIIEDNL